MWLSPKECYDAVVGRDRRFDGRFVVCVKTTGVYCRPSCTTKTPAHVNVVFYETPAEAEAAHFRPCRKCRPDAEPGTPAWVGSSTTVSRALRLIEDGVLDHANLDTLCDRLGVGPRQLRRLFRQHIGTTPVLVAQRRRAHFARRLIDTTNLPMAHVAEAAGFGSVRRFNDVMNDVYGCSPSELRRSPRRPASGLELQIAVRQPFPWSTMLEFLAPCAMCGIERVEDGRYHRVARFRDRVGHLSAAFDAQAGVINVRASASLTANLLDVVSGVRRLFDVDTEPGAIADRFAADPVLGPQVKRRPGLRVPGAFDYFEVAVRTLLGQRVGHETALTLTDRLVKKWGKSVDTSRVGLTHAFPTPRELSFARLEMVGIPRRRARTIQAMARAVDEGTLRLDGSPSLDETIRGLRAIPGIGSWSADYIAMRVYREPDAFPAGDLGLRAAASPAQGGLLSVKELEERAERWRPWRAYAAMYLWTSLEADALGSAPLCHGVQDYSADVGQVA